MPTAIRPARADDVPFLAWVILAASRAHVNRGAFDLTVAGPDAEIPGASRAPRVRRAAFVLPLARLPDRRGRRSPGRRALRLRPRPGARSGPGLRRRGGCRRLVAPARRSVQRLLRAVRHLRARVAARHVGGRMGGDARRVPPSRAGRCHARAHPRRRPLAGLRHGADRGLHREHAGAERLREGRLPARPRAPAPQLPGRRRLSGHRAAPHAPRAGEDATGAPDGRPRARRRRRDRHAAPAARRSRRARGGRAATSSCSRPARASRRATSPATRREMTARLWVAATARAAARPSTPAPASAARPSSTTRSASARRPRCSSLAHASTGSAGSPTTASRRSSSASGSDVHAEPTGREHTNRNARRLALGARAPRLGRRGDAAQRARLREPRPLQLGLPERRQAVDARHLRAARRARRRARRSRTRAPSACASRRAPCAASRPSASTRDRRARRDVDDRRAARLRRRRRARDARAAAAQRGSRRQRRRRRRSTRPST